jgi:catechol 2,3-dioxygenase-like lactoylglutathione lyase family enzyme
MNVIGVNHAQVNVSLAQLPQAREFYLGFLGMKEITRPAVFKSEGFWFHAGEFETHIGVEENVDRRATRAHLAYEVTDVVGWRKKIEAAGLPIKDQPKIPGCERFHFRDPFGNNIELIERVTEVRAGGGR